MSAAAQSEDPPVRPGSRAALLLMDYHGAIVHMIQSEDERTKVLSAAGKLLHATRQHSIPTAHCLIDGNGEALPTSRLKSRWESTFKPMIDSKPEMFAEWPDLAAPKQLTSQEITSSRTPGIISALKAKDLLDFLKSQNVETLVLAGIATSGVVISTAREAADMGFVTTIVEEACADSKPHVHKAIIEDVLPMTCWVVDLQKGLKLLGGDV